MRQNVRYRVLTIPGKVRVEISVGIDDQRSPEFASTRSGGKSVSLTLFPYISINIIRPSEIDETGARSAPTWNANDSLGMTKFNFPIFLEEIRGIKKDMKIPELYSYQGSRLELNEEVSSKIRRVFMVGATTLELTAVVVTDENTDTRVEGIKMKFNNEQSSVILTLNELASLVYTLEHTDIDTLTLMIYTMYMRDPKRPKVIDGESRKPIVDIVPKSD